jgi:HEAT repeat protein
VIVHSFFVVPLLIALTSVLAFLALRMLTADHRTAFDYLNDIRAGGISTRWQSAFELSTLLGRDEALAVDPRFNEQLAAAFINSRYDANAQVRQYLALALGRTGNSLHLPVLLEALETASEEDLPYIVHALGLLGDADATPALHALVGHPEAPVRLQTAIALGRIGSPESLQVLRPLLNDPEPNVRWDGAVALAKLGDDAGRAVLLDLMNRDYYDTYAEVDPYEQSRAMVTAVFAAAELNDPELNAAIRALAEGDRNMEVRRAALEALE